MRKAPEPNTLLGFENLPYKLTDAERATLRDEAMRLYYGCEPQPARAHRR